MNDNHTDENGTSGIEQVSCRCGRTHEVYEGYRTCPFFRTKVEILARKEDAEPTHILSTGKWIRPVSDAELGIIDCYGDTDSE